MPSEKMKENILMKHIKNTLKMVHNPLKTYYVPNSHWATASLCISLYLILRHNSAMYNDLTTSVVHSLRALDETTDFGYSGSVALVLIVQIIPSLRPSNCCGCLSGLY